jgi:hypothetical protein
VDGWMSFILKERLKHLKGVSRSGMSSLGS